MKPGKELDMLISNIVFKTNPSDPNPYSTDIKYAFEVVEHIRKTHWLDVFSLLGPSDESKFWFVGFEKKWHGRGYSTVYDRVHGITAAHAICMAAIDIMKLE